MIDQRTVTDMSKAGIVFFTNVRAPGGVRELMLSPDEVADFVKDPDFGAAKKFDLTKAEYQEWVERDGYIQCSASTLSGTRCKNIVSGGSFYDADAWKRTQGEYCAVHGGPGAEPRE